VREPIFFFSRSPLEHFFVFSSTTSDNQQQQVEVAFVSVPSLRSFLCFSASRDQKISTTEQAAGGSEQMTKLPLASAAADAAAAAAAGGAASSPPPPSPSKPHSSPSFRFGTRKDRIDWGALHGVDVERMVREETENRVFSLFFVRSLLLSLSRSLSHPWTLFFPFSFNGRP